MVEGDGFSGKADQLFEGGLGIPQTAFGLTGQKNEGFIGDFHFLGIGNFAQVRADEGIGDAAQIKPLATGENGGGEFLDFGRGENKFYVSGRFFEGFKEGIEGLVGQHVDFVDDVDFKFSAGGGIGDSLAQLLDAVDPAVGGTIDFEDIEAAPLFNLLTDIVVGVEIGLGAVRAVESFGEDAGGGGFANATGTNKEKGVGQPTFGDRVGESAHDMFLSDQFGKGAGAILSGENEITHRASE